MKNVFIIFAITIILITNSICKSKKDPELRSARNLKMINTINEMKTTWKAAANSRFEKMTFKDVKKLMGSLKTPEEKKPKLKNVQKIENLPENFDLREQWSQCESIHEIRDQAGCGSCWAFGAAEAMSDRICIASNGRLQTRISPENILSCCKMCGSGCRGGFPYMAWDMFTYDGIPTGGLYGDNKTCQPYSFKPCDHFIEGKLGPCDGEYPTPECSQSCSEGYPKTFNEDKSYGSDYYRVSNDEEEIKSEIFNHGSVQASYAVYEDFLNYKEGVYQHVEGSYMGGHAVKIIGWGVENGTKYWLIANSWNVTWGNNGFFKILRGSDHLGIESELVAGIPNLNSKYLKFLE